MEGDEDRSLVCVLNAISIHSLRMEGDPSPTWEASKPMPFQSTPSAWRETVLQVVGQSTGHHFNPLPPHGGRPLFRSRFRFPRKFQSTPSAWRETGLLLGDGGGNSHFNPLPPHGGRPQFQPEQLRCKYFNPLPPHGGRHIVTQFTKCTNYFNPLPPHGGRLLSVRQRLYPLSFQSTPSAWRETFAF